MDQARYCTGLPCPRHLPHLKKGKNSQAGNATGGRRFLGGLFGCISLTADFKGECSPSPTEHNLSAANGQRLHTFGRRNASIIFLRMPCSHDMVVADVVNPILGMDFFQDGEGKRYIIDPHIRCLTDRFTAEEFPVDNKTSSFFSLISATPAPNHCHYESGELSNASNVDDY